MKERHTGVRKSRRATLKSLKKYEKLDITLNQSQHDEFLKTVAAVTQQCPEQLEKIFSEADAQGRGEIVRRLWKHDVDDRVAFDKDQRKNGNNYSYT